MPKHSSSLTSATDHVQIIDLIYAIESGRLRKVEQLIAAGVKVNAPIVPGDYYRDAPALLRAADLGEVDICRVLIEAGADLAATNSRSRSALHAAAGSCCAETCEVLIAAGANVNARDHKGETPLFTAVHVGAKEVFESLLSAGADPDARSLLGTTPLHFAASRKESELGRKLLEQGAAAQVPARIYIPYSDAPWSASALGKITALHLAVDSNSLELCRDLVAHGADPSFMPKRMVDKDYLSPIQEAIAKKRYDIVNYFLFECETNFGQRTAGNLKRSLAVLAEGDEKILEWLRAAETQQGIATAIVAQAGSPSPDVNRTLSGGPL
jgi:ankyrin repeat protein